MAAKPHVSPALAALRLWVTIAATLVVLAAGTQMLVFGIVWGTDVRHTHVASMIAENAPLVVVNSDANRTKGEATQDGPDKGERRIKDGRVLGPAPAPVDVNRVLAPADGMLRRTSGLAVGMGSVACVMLAALCLLGVCVAGGASVPGVERAVGAATWALVLALVGLPWRDLMPSLPAPGVFGDYDVMVAGQELAAHEGGSMLMLVATYLGLPLVMVVCSTLVCLWFRSGVERGVIYTSVSQIDRSLEREMSAIRDTGVATRQPRAIGALYRAIGDAPGDAPEADAAPAPPAIAGSLLRRDPPQQRSMASDRPMMGQAEQGVAYPRPI